MNIKSSIFIIALLATLSITAGRTIIKAKLNRLNNTSSLAALLIIETDPEAFIHESNYRSQQTNNKQLNNQNKHGRLLIDTTKKNLHRSKQYQ